MTEGQVSPQFTIAVSAFLDALAPFEPVTIPSLAYLAFRRNDEWHLFHGRVNYNVPGVTLHEFHVRTPNIFAGFEILKGGSAEARDRIREIADGILSAGGERLIFSPQFSGGYAASYIPLLPEGVERQLRVALLQIKGSDQYGFTSHAPFDWELRAAETPFDGMGDLLGALGLPTLPGQSAIFEAMAFQITVIRRESRVEGERAHIGLGIVTGLDRDQASVGYRVLSNGAVVARGRIPGKQLRWRSETGSDIGETEIQVPAAAVVQAFACYAGTAYQHWWFNDPAHSQNPRRAAFARSDPDLQILQSFLAPPGGKQARDVEFAVSWLLWMLGFSPAHLGANSRMSDAADLLVTTPQGHFGVVECTTGVIKAEHKLARLVERSEAVRKELELSNNLHLRVLPVMITTKTREEVRGELDDARRAGVVVVTGDDLPELVSRTLLLPDADQLYAEAEASLREPQLGQIEPELPLPGSGP